MTEATTDTKEKKPNYAKLIGRGMWMAQYKKENPKAAKEDRAAAWAEVREAQILAGRRAVRALKKAGFEISKKAG